MGWPSPRTSSKAPALSEAPSARALATAPSAEAEQLAALRADLMAADYTVSGVAELLGSAAGSALANGQPLLADRLTEGSRDPAAVLLRLFVLGLPVDTSLVEHAVPRTTVAGLLSMGLASMGLASEANGEQVRATVDLRPYADVEHDWWVVSDLTAVATGAPLGGSHVVGVGGASSTLASWTPRPWAPRVLDVGTGSGVQALHLHGHTAYRVVSDLSERALGFARFTCALNEVRVDARLGSLFEPVAGEVFDLIVCNPPFVITPRAAELDVMEYRDGGAVGDDVVAAVVSQVGQHLAPGGIASLLGNWEIEAGQGWQERVRSWLPAGVDAWIVQREEQGVADYALTWAQDAGHPVGSPEFHRWYAAWLDDFAARGVERVGFGIITLQRPSENRPTFVHLEEVTSAVAAPMGPIVLRGLRARAWLAMHTDDDVLSVPWSVAQDVTEERIGAPGAPDPMVIQLRQGGGLARVVRLDSWCAGLLGALDGELTAAQIVQALAVLSEVPVEQIRAAVMPTLRGLVADGLLH